MKHLNEIDALLSLEGRLEGERENEILQHAALCPDCRKLLDALEAESAWLRERLAAEAEALPSSLIAAPSPAVSWPAGSWALASWSWIAAFAFAVAGASTLWNGFLHPWLARIAQAGFTQGNLLTTLFFTGIFWEGWSSMLSLTEFLAAAALGAIAIWPLLRWRRAMVSAAASASMAMALFCLLGRPSPAEAAVVAHGDPNYTLPAGQEIHTDLIVAGRHTEIDGQVDGDLIAFSQDVVVNGQVKGDVIALGQQVLVNGPVDGNVRAFAQSIALNGSVGKNGMTWARSLDVDRKAAISGTLTLGSSNAEVNGRVGGDLLALAQVLDIDGSLGGNATIEAPRLILGPEASVAGHIRYRGGRRVDLSPGAKLSSPIEMTAARRRAPRSRFASPGYYWRRILAWGASFLFGLVFLLVAPKFFLDLENASRRFGVSAGFGVLFLFAVPFAAILSCATIVGLGVGITALLFYSIALYAAQVPVGAWLGEKLLGPGVGTGPVLGRLALGLAILHALRMLPLAGGVTGFVVIIWGLGAIILALYQRMRPQPPVAAVPMA